MRRKTYLKILELHAELVEQHINEVRSIYKEMRGYKHDFHNHLQTLKGQVEAGEYERVIAYISELDAKLEKIDTLLKTGNITVDVILSSKLSKAKQAGIAVTAKANIPATLTISDVELSIVLGNLLDNAIDACEAVAGEKFIRLFLAQKGSMLYFSMLNSATKKQKKYGTLFLSNREGLHGFGLGRAESIIIKHGGWFKCNSEEGAFTTEFLVPAILSDDNSCI